MVAAKPQPKKPAAKPKDKNAEREQTKLLGKIIWEQKLLLFFAVPFMFIGGLGDFLFPDLIGRVINAMRDKDPDEVTKQLITWVIIICIGAVGTLCNSVLSGVTAERIGNSLRQKLYNSLIKKDTSFYDNARTGDLLSRLNSDTQVVQYGLSTSVAMFVKAGCTCTAMVVIMFTYSW